MHAAEMFWMFVLDKACSYYITILDCFTCVSYCMVCANVREGNPRALASGLSPVHMHNHTITVLLHQHACALCASCEIFDVKQ